MKRAPAQPGHVLVERVARERVSERGAAGLGLDDQAAREQLVEAGLVSERRDELDVELDPRHSGRLGGGAGRRRQVAGAQEHRVADGLRQRHLAVQRELDAVVPALQAPAGLQRGGQLLDEERRAAGAVVQRCEASRGEGASPSTCSASAAVPSAVSGSSVSSSQAAAAAQLVAQPSQPVRARDLVRAVGGDDEQRQLAQRRGERGEQLERWRRRTTGGRRAGSPPGASSTADASPQRMASNSVARSLSSRRLAELGQQQREVRAKRAAAARDRPCGMSSRRAPTTGP